MAGDKAGETEILVSQIESVKQNLERARSLFENLMILPGQYPEKFPEGFPETRIKGKFAIAIQAQNIALDGLQKKIIMENLDQGGIIAAWQELSEIKSQVNLIYSQCLDFLGGLAVKKWELEAGFCNLAEKMVAQLETHTGVSWNSVLILGDERPFDDIAEITEIIRLRFPEWDIWSLPFIACEYGQIVARNSFADKHIFGGLFGDEEVLIEELITVEDIDEFKKAKDLGINSQNLAPTFRKARQEYQANPDQMRAHLQDFVDHKYYQLKILFADIFATYFLGPAYIYARTYLRLIPIGIQEDYLYKPSMERRLAFMLATLKNMSEDGKIYDQKLYDHENNRFSRLWKETVVPVQSDYSPGKLGGEPYDSWFSICYQKLKGIYPSQSFTASDWEQAKDLAEFLLDEDPDLDPVTPVSVILNAAWIRRLDQPGPKEQPEMKGKWSDRVETRNAKLIAEKAYQLCMRAVQLQPKETLPDRQRKRSPARRA